MEAYGPSKINSAFAASRAAFDALVRVLADGEAGTLDHVRLEELVTSSGREVLRLLLQDHLDLRARREEGQLAGPSVRAKGPVDAAGAEHRACEKGHERKLTTVVGTVTVRRVAYRAPGRQNLYPADAALNLPSGLHSLGLRKRAVLQAVRVSFDAATSAITGECGPVLAKRQTGQLVAAAAVDVAAFYARRPVLPEDDATLLVLSFDAKGVVMRPGALRDATRKKAEGKGGNCYHARLAPGEKRGRKRMATVAAVYDAALARRRPHDVIVLPGAQREGRRRGPKATGKWLTSSLLRSPKEVIAEAFDRATERDPGHRRPWIVLVDGDRRQIDLVTAEAARRKATVTVVVDFVHVAEYVWKSAWCFYRSGEPEAEQWVGTQLLGILSGRLKATIAEIDERATAAELTEDQKRAINECSRYLKSKEPYLNYAGALAAGWPIATGIVEGACRHLIADRMDITGARWGLEGAEAVLTLRAVIANGDYREYWRFHVQQEHRRVHQSRYQQGFKLAA